jgi:hypothetical protein
MSGEIRIKAGQRFTEEDSVTAAKVNAVFAGMVATVRPGSIGAREIADGSVTAAKLSDAVATELAIADGSITTAKLADGCLAADVAGRGKMADGFVDDTLLGALAVTTAKIADGTVSATKLASGISVAPLRSDVEDVDGGQGSRITAWTEVMSVVITPTATSSKVLVVAAGNVGAETQVVGVQSALYKITRKIGAGAESDLLVGDSEGSRIQCAGGTHEAPIALAGGQGTSTFPIHVPYLDSPATVSAVTYKIYVKEKLTIAWGVCLNSSSNMSSTASGRQPNSSLIVMEVMGA